MRPVVGRHSSQSLLSSMSSGPRPTLRCHNVWLLHSINKVSHESDAAFVLTLLLGCSLASYVRIMVKSQFIIL
jgi:hypothetical protein